MTDLKPCPFCGGEAVVCGYPTEQMVYVKCRECGACSFGCQANEEKAAAAWNQRAERTCNPVNVDREDEDGRLHRMFHRCSECGHDLPYEAEKGHGCYCPHCGARVVS